MAKKTAASKYDEVIEVANSVASLWMEFRKYLRKSFSPQEVQSEDEMRFLEVKSELARLQRFLAQKLPEGLQYGAKGITDTMASSISIGTLRDLPAADKKNLYDRWHESYINLQRLQGVLDVLHDGYTVHFAVAKARSTNVKESIAGAKGKKDNKKKVITVAVLLIVIAIAAVMYMSRM